MTTRITFVLFYEHPASGRVWVGEYATRAEAEADWPPLAAGRFTVLAMRKHALPAEVN